MGYRIPPGEEAIERLEDFVVVNRLAPNTKIPSERDLCEMWGVSRTTLRQAVDTLVSQGVLYRINGIGVYVAEKKKDRNMLGVDAMLGELGKKGFDVSKKIIDNRKFEATKQISKKLKIPLGRKVYEYISLRSVDGIPCILGTTYIDYQSYPEFDKYYDEKNSIGDVFEKIYNKKQTSGEEHIGVTYASEHEAELLEIEPRAPLFFASGIVEDEYKTPIMYYKQLIRADQFKFVSTIEREVQNRQNR